MICPYKATTNPFYDVTNMKVRATSWFVLKFQLFWGGAFLSFIS